MLIAHVTLLPGLPGGKIHLAVSLLSMKSLRLIVPFTFLPFRFDLTRPFQPWVSGAAFKVGLELLHVRNLQWFA